MTSVLGVTIASHGYFEMAHRAAASFRRYSGCDCLILETDRKDSYDMKYSLPHLKGRTLCYFDADMEWIRSFDLEKFRQVEGVAAVRDVTRHAINGSFCLQDATSLGFPPERYCNTGLMIINPRNPLVVKAFDHAAFMMAERRAGVLTTLDTTEQSILNAAWNQVGMPLMFLPDEWNFWPWGWVNGFYDSLPLKPLNVHAAGVPLHLKAEYIAKQCAVWRF